MKKEQKQHADATAAFERRAADLEAARARLASIDPDDAARWSAADADVRRLEAAASRAAREAAAAKVNLEAARRTTLERELADVEARLHPDVLAGRLEVVRGQAAAAVDAFFHATVEFARAIDAQHRDVAECHRLSGELGLPCEHRRADRDQAILQLAEQLRETYSGLRTPRDLERNQAGLPLNLVNPRMIFPGGAPPPVEDT